MNKEKINIRPTTGVYATYRRLTYQPWTAIAEFVDNSTQSYFDHKKELKDLEDFEKLYIEITYEQDMDGNDILKIRDNAFGMEIEEFTRAFTLDKAPKNTSGRNEFGMGLKTAACWFGSKWTVTSSKLGSEYAYKAELDVDKLKADKHEEIEMDIIEEERKNHYTEITIERLNKRITGSRTIGKVKEFLSSIYRQDIRSGEVILTYNGETLQFKDPEVYKEKLENGEEKIWKKDINFSVSHNGKELEVNGFIAIRIPGSVKEAGFTLMRRGRTIVGGSECNYRPKELFGDSNSFAYQRLFGELHMDNWPVTQAKDQFDWHTDGLEEKFINQLQELTKRYKEKAESIRRREQISTEECMNNAIKTLQKSKSVTSITSTPIVDRNEDENVDKESIKDTEKPEEIYVPEGGDTTVIAQGPKLHKIPMEFNGEQYEFLTELIFDQSISNWLIIEKNEGNSYKININMKHPFFKPLIDNESFQEFMIRFVIAMVLAEIQAQNISFEGKIDPSQIRMQMNQILKELSN